MPTSHSTANLNSHWLNRAKKRLLSEFRKISDNSHDNIRVNFKEDQFLEWHFLFKGLKDTFFEGGEYHGMLKFPDNYPFSPPSIHFFTPNGRFKTNERVCFILSDFHPDCWKPGYTVSAVLQGAYSFMMSETTETVGSLIMDRNEIINLARMSKEFNRDNDTFNELFEEKVDEDIEHPLNNSDDASQEKNIELPSDLIPIPVPDTTRVTQSISTNKANERPSHLAKVDKEEHAIGQNSSFTANTPRNSSNCPSSSDKGKESHTSKLLERTLPERSESTNNHNSATRVSQYSERPDNVSVQSSDYVINNSHNNNRDTSDIPKPNREVSSERSNDSLRQNASSNRSMDSSKKSTTDNFSAILPKRSENAQMLKTGHRPNSLAQDQSGITSVASDSSKELSLRKSQPNLSYTTDKYSSNHLKGSPNSSTAHQSSSMVHISPSYSPTSAQDRLSQNTIEDDRSTHLSGRSEIVSIYKKDHTFKSFTHNEDGIPSVLPDSSKELFSKKSDLYYNTIDKWTNNHSNGSEKEYNRDNNTFNELFKEKTDESIKCPLDNFQTEHRKQQSTLIIPDSQGMIENSRDEFNKGVYERLSTDSVLDGTNNGKNLGSINSNHVTVQDRSVGVQPYSIQKAKEMPPKHSKVTPLEKAKHEQTTLELEVQTIFEKDKLSIKPALKNTANTLINKVNTETPAKKTSINISNDPSSDITEKQSKTYKPLTRSSLTTSRQNHKTITDKSVVHQPHPPEKCKDFPMQNSYRSHKYLVGNQGGIISTASDSTNKFPPQISLLNQNNNTADNCAAHPTGEFENVPRPKFDRIPHTLADKNLHSNYSSKVLSSLPSTILQEVHDENPITMQTVTTSSDKIVPRNTNSKLQDSDISNPIKNKAPENASVQKTSEFPRSYPLNSSVKSKSSQNLSVISTYNRPPSHPPISSNRNRPSQKTRDDKSITKSPSLPFLNRSRDHRNTNRLYLPPEEIGENSRSKSDQAPLSFAGNRYRTIFDTSDLSKEFSSQISQSNQTKTLDKRVANPSGRSENGSVSNYDRVLNYLPGTKGRIPTVPSDYLEDISSQISHLHQSKTIDKKIAHPPRESEKSPACNLDHGPHSSYDKKNDSTSDTSKQLECIPDVVVGSTSDKNLDQFYPLTEISNARLGKDSTISGEKNPIRSNTLHSDNPSKVFHSTPKVLPEVQYEDPSPIKANCNTSSSKIHRAVPLNHAFHSFDISYYSINNKSTQNLSARSFIKSPPTNPSNSSIKGKSPGNLSGKKTNKPPNSSIKNRPSVDSNTKRTIERTPSHLRNSSNTNNSSVNPSTKITNERIPSHLPNSSDTNAKRTNERIPSHFPNSSDTNAKRMNEGTPSHFPNSSNRNKLSVNPSTKRTNERTLFYPPNSSDKIEAFHNTSGNKSIDTSLSHSITSLNRPQFQGHGRTKTYALLPDGSSLISTSNDSSDLKHTGPIKNDIIPSSATSRSHDNQLKLLSIPASRTKSADKDVQGSNSHHFSFSANIHNHDDILNQRAKSNNQSFCPEKVECPKSFNSNPLPKEKSGRVMGSSNYATSSSYKDRDCNKINRGARMNPISNDYLSSHIKSLQRYDTHLSLRQAKSHFNSLLSHNAQIMEQLTSHGSGSEY